MIGVGSIFLRTTDRIRLQQLLSVAYGVDPDQVVVGQPADDSPWAELAGGIPVFLEQVANLDTQLTSVGFRVADASVAHARMVAQAPASAAEVSDMFTVADNSAGFNVTTRYAAELFFHE